MSMRYDEKGKLFTDVVSKISVPVIIQTTSHKIQGWVHTRPEHRIIDEINKQSDDFIAVTDAVIFGQDGNEEFQVEFLTLNLSHVVWIIPSDDISKNNPQE